MVVLTIARTQLVHTLAYAIQAISWMQTDVLAMVCLATLIIDLYVVSIIFTDIYVPNQDINECLSGSHSCNQTCQNTAGSYQCTCNSGYVLSSNGRSCNGKRYNIVEKVLVMT